MTSGDGVTARGAGSYASVNGLEMYHEIHGTGRPLILLHGGAARSRCSARSWGCSQEAGRSSL